MSSAKTELARLLEHPAIWRGRSAARTQTLPTGFGALDESLPGRGWPRAGLIEILVTRFGIGELYLLLPALATLTRGPAARWCVWVGPPLEPYAPALAAHGVATDQVLVVRSDDPLWAHEQALGCGACDAAFVWARRPHPREIRRLQLAAERGRTLGVLFRHRSAARESSPAVLRLVLEPSARSVDSPSLDPSVSRGVRVTLLKSRGGARGSIELTW
jgi:hypothetical protein